MELCLTVSTACSTNSLSLFFSFFISDICFVKVTNRDWLQGGKKGSSDEWITEDGRGESQIMRATRASREVC